MNERVCLIPPRAARHPPRELRKLHVTKKKKKKKKKKQKHIPSPARHRGLLSATIARREPAEHDVQIEIFSAASATPISTRHATSGAA